MSSDSSIEIPDENPPTSPSAFSSPSSTHAALSGDEAQSGPHTPQQSKTGKEAAEIANRTPIQLKVSTRQVAPKDKPYVPMMVQEMTDRHHEMALDDFMTHFAKVSALEDKIPDLFEGALKEMSKFDGLGGCTDEAQMYKHLCEGFNSALKEAKKHASAGQSYAFKDTSEIPETSTDDMKPDLSMYSDTAQAREAFLHNVDTTTSELKARTAWGWMTAAVEVKFHEKGSAFYFGDKDKEFVRYTDDGKKAQVQFAKYAAQIMLRQHRVSVFLIYICKTKARLTRWDRTGCIVSKPIDLKKEPEKLLLFMFRLGLMSPKELGYDETAVLATPDEVQRLKDMRHVNKYARARAREILKPETTLFHPIYKITRENVGKPGSSVYFVGKHHVATYSITGRATKGYIAFIVGKARLGFLKDYWRPYSCRITSELEIYEELHAAGVQHVATVSGGGDIRGQTTKTHRFLRDRLHAPTKRVHCCILFNELARPLEDYRDFEELVTIIYHALTAHKDAWVKAKILHRDISCANIMIVVDQEKETETDVHGILNDWDLCKHKHDLALEQTQNGRSGTWAYMSGVSLTYPLKPYQLSDDLEAFIHVVTSCCLRFHWHDLTDRCLVTSYGNLKPGQKLSDAELRGINGQNGTLSKHVSLYYDDYKAGGLNGSGPDSGGRQKMIYAKGGLFGWTFTFARKPSKVLVESLCELLTTHYKTIDFEKLEKHYFAGEGTGTLSTIEEGSTFEDNDWDRGVETDSATSDPFTKEPNPGQDLNTHSRIMTIFQTACDSFRDIKAQGLRPKGNDKSPDQFLGLAEVNIDLPKGPSGSRRLASARTSASRASASAENFQGTDSPSTQAVKKRKSNTDETGTRPSKVSRTSEQRSVGESAQSEVVEDAGVNDGVVGDSESEEER